MVRQQHVREKSRRRGGGGASADVETNGIVRSARGERKEEAVHARSGWILAASSTWHDLAPRAAKGTRFRGEGEISCQLHHEIYRADAAHGSTLGAGGAGWCLPHGIYLPHSSSTLVLLAVHGWGLSWDENLVAVSRAADTWATRCPPIGTRRKARPTPDEMC